MELIKEKIVLFDGICNLCQSTVQFVIKHDHRKKIRFASLQGEFGQQVLKEHNLPLTNYNSFLFLENGRLHMKSGAALRLSRYLDGVWPLFYILMIIPPFLRNAVYGFIAKNRYRWFGKQESCWLPTPDLKQRFLN
ncbi:MAG: thiol-disulfide oxidoreductase DCC family protein [Chitinophagaceae bacterium]